MLLRTPKETKYRPVSMDEIKNIIQDNRHSHLQNLDLTRYTITGLDRKKYYLKCETNDEARQLIEYYEEITGRSVLS